MLKRFLVVVFFLLVSIVGMSQSDKVWTLEDCIVYAEGHSIQVQKQIISTDKSRLALQEGKWAFYPSLSVSSNFTSSTGRVLDPTTYQFVQTNQTSNSSSSVSSDILLFGGGRKIHALNKAKLSLRAGLLNEESVRYNLKINVIAAYMDVLCAMEQMKIAQESANLVKEQMQRAQNLFDAGSITESDILQFKAQLYAAENDVSEANRSKCMALLSICDLLEIEDYMSFKIAEPEETENYPELVSLDTAVERHPEYRLIALNRSLAESDYKIAKSNLYPTLSLSAGYGASWSDARQKSIVNPDGTVKFEAYPFFQQYADNASAYISVGLKIPVLNGLSARNSSRRAKLAVKESEYTARETYETLRKEIIQAQIDCETAKDNYMRAAEEVKYAEEAYRQISDKYNLGVTDYLTWNTALVESTKARYLFVESKYSFFLKLEILKVCCGL